MVLSEENRCGSGAGDRNGGFALRWWPKLRSVIALRNEEEVRRLSRTAEQAVAEIGCVYASNEIDAHIRHAAWRWAAVSPLHVGT